MLVTFEGVDGSGKSSLMALVAEKLGRIFTVKATKEPGGHSIPGIRDVIFNPTLDKNAELMLFLGDRIHHIQTVIIPSLEANDVTLCDRHYHSTLVYQGEKHGVDKVIEAIRFGNELQDFVPQPTFTFLIAAPPETCIKRLQGREVGNKFDSLDANRIAHRAYTFKEVLELTKTPYMVVSNEGDIHKAADKIVSKVEDLLCL